MIWETKKVRIESADLQWDGSEEALAVIKDFVPSEFLEYRCLGGLPTDKTMRVYNILESQWLNVPIGHWVVKGLKGEFYPCEPGAMDAKYFEVDDDTEEFDDLITELINGLKSVGGCLAGPEYIKESDMVDMGDYLVMMAKRLEKYGIK